MFRIQSECRSAVLQQCLHAGADGSNSQTVVLGALCVAWNSAIQPLDPERERTLVKFAKAAMHVMYVSMSARRQRLVALTNHSHLQHRSCTIAAAKHPIPNL